MADLVSPKVPGTNTSRNTTKLNTEGWLRGTIYMESITSSIMTRNQGLIHPIKAQSQTEAIKVKTDKPIVRISEKDDGVFKSDGKVTISKLLSLQGSGFKGRTLPEDTEDEIRTRQLTISANLSGNALTEWGLGIDKLNESWMNLNSATTTLLAQWIGEVRDRKMHEAYCTRYSSEQLVAPSSLTASLNPNVLFCQDNIVGITDGVVPYSTTQHAENIGDAAAASTDANNHITVERLIDMSDIASDNFRIKPIMIEGEEYYILYAAPEEVRRLRKSQKSGSYAADWLGSRALGEAQKIVPGAKMGVASILVIEDKRNATASITGADTSWGIAFGYLQPGWLSTRHNTLEAKKTFNVNVLVGAESLFEYNRQGVSFAKALPNYGFIKGEAIYDIDSFTLPCFDVDVAGQTASTIANEGSLLLLSARESTIGN